jgi:hypothetical protein
MFAPSASSVVVAAVEPLAFFQPQHFQSKKRKHSISTFTLTLSN